jgi:uncharacterized lipoprotein YddW (UPF0748 family)
MTKIFQLPIKIVGLLIVHIHLFTVSLPTQAQTTDPILSVVKDSSNQQRWRAIANRLQASGVNYCVIPLPRLKITTNFGKPKILLLPNIETLTPEQAIALEQWTQRGGKLIATGPVGSLSTPGVRQLLQKLLGGYWGFSLNSPQQLQSANSNVSNWVKPPELFGKVRGGVIIPNPATSQTSAVWQAQGYPAAVLTSATATFLGWRWGIDTASSRELDVAWLKAALQRYVELPKPSPKPTSHHRPCDPASTTNTKPKLPPIGKKPKPNTRRKTHIAGNNRPSPTKLQSAPKPTPSNYREAIDQLEEAVRLDVVPNSSEPISPEAAIALQQELENLIGRVESAHLAASISGSSPRKTTSVTPQPVKSITSSPSEGNLQVVLAQAREIAKNLPFLVERQNFALARQQWLQAKTKLWQQFPIDQRLAQPEIRAVWLDRGTIIRAGSEAGLAKIFNQLAKAGINTVFFETVNASYTIYPSRVAPQQNPLVKNWDPLAAAVKLAHGRGMELHAWVWTFAAGNQQHNQILNLDPNYPGPVLAARPDWANYDQQGNMIPLGQTKPFFDPANPQARQYLLDLFAEIVTRYQVDGLQLDYIRYPFQDPFVNRTYGYGQAAREQFLQQTGVDPVNISPTQGELWQKWTAFRTQQVDSFVAEVSQMLRSKRQNLTLSVAVFPLPEYERIQKLQQNWEVWAKRGDIDLVVPMTYALDTPRFQRLAQPWIKSTQLGATLLVPGIRLLSLPNLGAFDQLQLVRDLPAIGYALFAAENFNNQLDEILIKTQGQSSVKGEPIPHRHPFRAAAWRYAALQKEWQFMQEQGQLSISANVLADFNRRSEELNNALNQLAVVPSASNLIEAKNLLNQLQSQFPSWMQSATTPQSYHIQVWQHRLLTIDRLLRYGERRRNLQL